MKKVAIFFRNKNIPNVFRDIILKSLSSDFSKYIVCSAFFQHPYRDKGRRIGKFTTSYELLDALYAGCNQCTGCLRYLRCYRWARWARWASQYSTTGWNIHINGIHTRCRRCIIKKNINIYGLYEAHFWPLQYHLTCKKLFTYGCPFCMKFSFFKFKKKKSHAKIFIAKDCDDKPKLAIIGSSNLSAGAFSNTTPRWNQECDVIFWDETDECAQGVMNTVLEYLGEEDRKMLFVTNYNEEDNNSSLEKKLMNLEQQIINKELVNVYDVGSNF